MFANSLLGSLGKASKQCETCQEEKLFLALTSLQRAVAHRLIVTPYLAKCSKATLPQRPFSTELLPRIKTDLKTPFLKFWNFSKNQWRSDWRKSSSTPSRVNSAPWEDTGILMRKIATLKNFIFLYFYLQ